MDDYLNILVADDHDLVRDGLKLILGKMPEQVNVLEARNADEVQQALADDSAINLVILDLHMPGANGLELLTNTCNDYPDLAVVVLSAEEDPKTMQRAITRGATGFIPKSSANEVLVSALHLVLAGGVYIPTEMLKRSATVVQPEVNATTGKLHGMCETHGLTLRQIDVMDLLSDGYSNKVIARKLGLSEHTVKIHISAIFRVLGVNNRTEAALAYRGLVSGA